MTAHLKALGDMLAQAAGPRRFTQHEAMTITSADAARLSPADRRELTKTQIRIWQGNYLEQSAADDAKDAQEAFDNYEEDSLQRYLRREVST